MQIRKFVNRTIGFTSVLMFIIGGCGVAGAQDQQTVKKLQLLIEQQQKQLEAQQKALEAQNKALRDLKKRVETLTKDEAVVEVQAAEAERLAEEAVRKAQEAKAEADRAHREAIAVDVQKEEDLHRTQGKTFHIPDTKTVLTLSGFIKADVIHDFDKIESPYKFAARRIVVRGHSSDEPSSRTTVTANPSRFVIASATPTDWGKLSTFFSFDAAENTTSSDPDFRFRQGWGQLDDIFWRGSVACRSVLVELGRCHGPAGDHGFRGPQRLPADPPGPGSMGARFPKKIYALGFG